MEIKRTTDVEVDQFLLGILQEKDEPSARDVLAAAQDTLDWLMKSKFFREYLGTLFCGEPHSLVISADPFLEIHQDGKIELTAFSDISKDPLDDPEFAARCANAIKPLTNVESALRFFAERFNQPFHLDPEAVEAERRINGTVHLFVIADLNNIRAASNTAMLFSNHLKKLQLDSELQALDINDPNAKTHLKDLPENSLVIIDTDPTLRWDINNLFYELPDSTRDCVIVNAPLGVDHPTYRQIAPKLLQRPTMRSLMEMNSEQLAEFLQKL